MDSILDLEEQIARLAPEVDASVRAEFSSSLRLLRDLKDPVLALLLVPRLLRLLLARLLEYASAAKPRSEELKDWIDLVLSMKTGPDDAALIPKTQAQTILTLRSLCQKAERAAPDAIPSLSEAIDAFILILSLAVWLYEAADFGPRLASVFGGQRNKTAGSEALAGFATGGTIAAVGVFPVSPLGGVVGGVIGGLISDFFRNLDTPGAGQTLGAAREEKAGSSQPTVIVNDPQAIIETAKSEIDHFLTGVMTRRQEDLTRRREQMERMRADLDRLLIAQTKSVEQLEAAAARTREVERRWATRRFLFGLPLRVEIGTSTSDQIVSLLKREISLGQEIDDILHYLRSVALSETASRDDELHSRMKSLSNHLRELETHSPSALTEPAELSARSIIPSRPMLDELRTILRAAHANLQDVHTALHSGIDALYKRMTMEVEAHHRRKDGEAEAVAAETAMRWLTRAFQEVDAGEDLIHSLDRFTTDRNVRSRIMAGVVCRRVQQKAFPEALRAARKIEIPVQRTATLLSVAEDLASHGSSKAAEVFYQEAIRVVSV